MRCSRQHSSAFWDQLCCNAEASQGPARQASLVQEIRDAIQGVDRAEGLGQLRHLETVENACLVCMCKGGMIWCTVHYPTEL